MPTLFDYQQKGRDLLVDHPAYMLGDKPGAGKTAQGVSAAAKRGARRILVVCPEILRVNWAREFQLWWPQMFSDMPKIIQASKKSPPPHRAEGIYIVNYNKLSLKGNAWRNYLLNIDFDVIILDEAHALKNPTSQRTKFIYGELFKKNPTPDTGWFLLSGTFAPNHPGELYPHLRRFWPEKILREGGDKPMTRIEFEDKFCQVRDTQWGRAITGVKNTDQIKTILSDVHIQRSIDGNLPPLTFREHVLDIPTNTAQAKTALADADRAVQALLDEHKDNGTDFADAMQAAEIALATQRRAFGVLKAPAVVELMEQELHGNFEKRIVFAWHREVIDILTKGLGAYGCVTVDGRSSKADTQDAVDRFQKDPECRVFIGQLQKCGEGLTLTASNHVVFAEASWVPKDNYQGAKRASRIGQKHAVLARFLTASGTTDEIVMRSMLRKTKNLSDTMGDKNIVLT